MFARSVSVHLKPNRVVEFILREEEVLGVIEAAKHSAAGGKK